ncbi:epidermal growth factor receptor substrate 15-like [Selaginella moellendorffii]|uniref:epidermal growth factor receptor substrate 15-like n=1 Tax=Selaginella moellendorffii TaxID=88036 RepID=UPI000D1CE2FA|nr:epidermal growth factor receptor substrate 15-like [Selaginella moellendorffii]|eukprot:XP_024536277.1 epidermal growth factor receptor substrate 15-like [Selaginella moellendorffii]
MADPAAFDFFFQQADVDRDGKVSGAEAIHFFKGSNLPQPVLAKIWHAADNGHTGFLSRPEFYNALKLVTVAQSGRELTPEIMRAALVGPASLKIPAPKIQLPAGQQSQIPVPGQQAPPPLPVSTTQVTVQPGRTSFSSGPPPPPLQGSLQQNASFSVAQPAPGASPRPSFTGGSASQPPSYTGATTLQPQQGPSFPGATTPQPQQTPSFASATASQPTSSFASAPLPQPQQTPSFPTQLQQAPSFATNANTSQLQQTPPFATAPTPQPQQTPRAPVYQQQPPVQSVPRPGSSGGLGAESWRPSSVQGQLFSSATPVRPTTSAIPNQSFSVNNGPSTNFASQQGPGAPPGLRAGAGAPDRAKASGGFSPFGNDAFSVSSTTARPAIDQNFVASSPLTPRQPSPGMSPQAPPPKVMHGFRPPMGAAWPKMTANDVQRYSRVFTDVDTDKDGKITGIQARDLFLSWRLPRDVLKQVWDLSDQDGDSMLSFREFSTALYLMERLREGRPLPPVLPAGFHFDDGTPQSHLAAAQGYNQPSWQRNARPGMPPGLVPQEQFGMPGAFQGQQTGRHARARPRGAEFNGSDKPNQSEGKVLDSKEKLEYYRNKLQEIVLFKRKCDNRLSEITDRAAAEKREEEIMAKKYEEKYKQALEVNSRLVSEEAAFRETQTLKSELRSAIAEIERGGNPNALLQTRADRIANDLDELEKALVQRGNLLGLQVSGTAKVELPFGWQPGLQENAVEWDEDWDKFDDEGYNTIQGIMDEQPVSGTASHPGWDENSMFADGFDFASEPIHAEENFDKGPADSPHAESETSSIKSGVDSPQWSPKGYPSKRSIPGSSPLSAKADHSFESHEDEPPFHSSSFDQDPSFDSTDHYEETPWTSAFGNPNEDVWGLGTDSPSSSFQPLAVKTRSERDFLDLGSMNISSPAHSEAKNEGDFFGKKEWNDWPGDTNSTSVPSTPLFKSESPKHEGSYFGQPSRLEL